MEYTIAFGNKDEDFATTKENGIKFTFSNFIFLNAYRRIYEKNDGGKRR